MDRFTIDLSLPNMITIGIVGALWYLLIVGGYSIAVTAANKSS